MNNRLINHFETTGHFGAGRKIFAALMCVILVVGLMPMLNLQNAYAASAQETAVQEHETLQDTVAAGDAGASQDIAADDEAAQPEDQSQAQPETEPQPRISADEQADNERIAVLAEQTVATQDARTADIHPMATEEDGFQWEITSGGQLVISPLDGQETGQLGNYVSSGDVPWADYASGILSVNFEGNIKSGTAMNYMFYGDTELTYVFNSENLDTSACTSMTGMFGMCTSLLSIDMSTWDVSHVTDMTQMFYNCQSLETVTTESEDSTTGWSQQGMVCKSFNEMFFLCYALADVTPTRWVTASTVDVSQMFRQCQKVPSLDCSGWDTTNVQDMSFLFTYCLALEKLTTGDGWDTGNVTTMESMFSSCSALDFDVEDLSQKIAEWDVSKVTSTIEMFYQCYGLKSFGGWKDFAPTSKADGMFIRCANVVTIDVSNWDISRIDSFDNMFSGCSSLEEITGLDTWENSTCTYFTCMFQGCSSLTKISLGMAGHASMFAYMFDGCAALEELYIPNITTYNASSESSFMYIFDGCDNLRTIQVGERFNFCGMGLTTTYLFTFPTPTFSTATGNWVSQSTGAVYTAATIPNTTADTYTAQTSDVPIIESGDGQTAVQGDDVVFVVMCFGDGIESVAIDGTQLAADNYTIARSGNKRIVSISGAYVQASLAAGTHTVTITCSNGSVSAAFTVPEATWEGSGTESDPYQISNYAELELLATAVNSEGKNFTDTYFTVTDDIDATRDAAGNAVNWEPIGNHTATQFSGTFLGNEHTITVDINRPNESEVGLFGAVCNATITGVIVAGNIVGGNDVAGIVGYIGSSASSTSDATTIRYCGNRANISGGSTNSNGEARVGGIVGYSYNQLSIISCYNRGSVTNTNTNTNPDITSHTGGIIGNAYNTTIESCYNRGDVTSDKNSTSYNYAGGLLGMGNSSCSFVHCYSTGTITSKGTYTGALAGSLINAYYRCENGDSAYLEGTANCAVGTDNGSDANGITYKAYQPLSSEALKAYDFGDEFILDDADDPINDGYPHLVWEGTGEIPDVQIIYDIYSAEDMWEFASAVRYGHSYSGETVTVHNDIDLEGEITDMNTGEGKNLWAPIASASTVGSGSTGFAGTFDGGGNTIKNMVVTSGTYMGLFAQIASGAVVQDVTVDGSIYSYGSSAGSIVGWNHGTVSGCTSNVEVNTYSCDNVGGIVADNDGKVLNCVNNGNVGDAYSSYVGGIAGHDEPYLNYDYSVISGCENNGEVTGYQYVGGITGGVWDGYIYCCVNNGDVTGYMTLIGGIVGDAAGGYYVVIENVANNGTVQGSRYNVGSLAGRIQYSGYLSYSYYLTGTCDAVVGTNTGSVYNNTEVSEPVASVEDVHWCEDFTEINDKGHSGTCYYCGATFTANHIYDASTASQRTRTCVVCGYEHTATVDISQCTIILSQETFTYNGQAQMPMVTVRSGNTILGEGIDYTLSVRNNVNAYDDPTITISGTGDYCEGSIQVHFTIIPAKATITCNDATKVYGEKDPELSGTVDGLISSGDLGAITYTRDVGEVVGEYAITANYTSNDNYEVEVVDGTFTITPADLSSATVTFDPESYEYTGEAITPKPTVKLGDVVLNAESDYTLSYSGNVDPGEATVTVTGTGNYTGTTTGTFTIKQASEPEPEPTPTTHEITIDPVDHASVSVDPTEAAEGNTVTITVTPDENYTVDSVTVTATNGDEVKVTAGDNGTYTFTMPDSDVAIEVKVSASSEPPTPEPEEYTIAVSDGDTGHHGTITVEAEAEAGDSVTIKVEASEGYVLSTLRFFDADTKEEITASCNLTQNNDGTWSFTMPSENVIITPVWEEEPTPEPTPTPEPEKIQITTDMFDVDTTYGIYDGTNPVTKTVSSDLTEGVDYTVTYTNNTSAGTATITITGIGDYEGTLTYTFKIIHYFEDVGATVNNTNEWYFDAVYGMVDLGAITGYNETIFGVGNSMTRAELVTIMWRYCEPDEYATYDEKNAKDTTGLPDAKDGMYYTGAVNWAYANSVITGNQHEDGTYTLNPDDPVTFEQMVTILARYCLGSFDEAADYPQTALDNGNFTDKDAVEDWAAGSMSWAIANGVVTGNDNHDGTWTLSPLEDVARERAVTVLYRSINEGLL